MCYLNRTYRVLPTRRVTPECDEDEEQYNDILKRIAPTTNDQMMVPT